MPVGTLRISRSVAFTVLGKGQKLLRKTSVEEHKYINYSNTAQVEGRGGVVIKALRYKPAGRGFDSR